MACVAACLIFYVYDDYDGFVKVVYVCRFMLIGWKFSLKQNTSSKFN